MLYAALARFEPLSNGAFTRTRSNFQCSGLWSHGMLDLIYIALGLSLFMAFVLGVRAAERV
jgi:hypothetical protein